MNRTQLMPSLCQQASSHSRSPREMRSWRPGGVLSPLRPHGCRASLHGKAVDSCVKSLPGLTDMICSCAEASLLPMHLS